jgi:hypothetical protein
VKKPNLKLFAITACLALCSGAMAQTLSKADFKSGKDKIGADYQLAKSVCEPLTANARDICFVEAKGKEKVARAELEASYKASARNRYEVRVARSNADYALAREKCDDQADNAKDVCLQEAKATKVAALADAKVQMKTSDANAAATKKTAQALSQASQQKFDVRNEAVIDQLDAQYKVEKEKCEAFAGQAKEQCQVQAKALLDQ